MSLNNKKVGSINNKIRKITKIKKYIVDTIDNSQTIKRYMRYLTTMPLSNRGVDYSGSIKIQPDLKQTLSESNNEGERCLFNFGFNPEMSNCQCPFIFIENKRDILGNPNGKLIFYTHILCPEKYNTLKLYSQERLYELAIEIVELLDETYVEGEAVKEIGNIKFMVEGEVTEWRLTKSQDIMVLSFPIICTVNNMRAVRFDG